MRCRLCSLRTRAQRYARTMEPKDETMSEGEAALASLLRQLWELLHEAPGKPCSLGRLSKRAQLRMSVLMRQLSVLSDAGLVEVAAREEGGASVAFTRAGRELGAAWFGA